MAEEGKRFTTRTSNILSRAGKSANANQQQAASSSAAAKSGSTTTPTVTQTPKVASTAKAMPSITRPDISTIVSKYSVPKTTQTTTQRAQVPDLLANRTWINPLKKASPDLLNWDTWTNSLSSMVNKWLYEVPETITQKFWESKVGDFFSNTMIDTERTLISGVQWYINKLANSDLLPSSNLFPTWLADKVLIHYANKALNNSEAWDILKGQRNSVLKTIFDVTENLDQYGAANKKYKQYKSTAENWAKQWNSILDAIEEWKWDVVSTRVWETIGQMLPSFITAVLTKNPWLTATTIFGSVFWDSYQRSLREINQTPEFANLTTDKKDDLATLMAVSEAWIETLWDLLELAPFTKWKLSINNLLWLKNVLASFVANRQWSAAVEWLEEVATEILQTVFKKAYWWTDDVTAKELWDIFMDTYLIMQFVWAPWWVAWWAQTYRRNAYVKLLSKEAEKFESFNEFEASAKRWGVNDDSLIQEAWADSKWLTKREAWILKYDVNYVENQEKKTTKLYEEKEKVENKIESLRESWEEKNKPQINKLETRLQEIDNQINEIDKSIQEYMEIYWDRSETKETQEALEELYNEINWTQTENLSEQTMVDMEETRLPSTGNDYKSFAEAIKQPQNTILKTLSDWDLIRIDEWAERMRAGADPELVEALDFVRKAVQKEMKERYEQRKKEPQKETTKTKKITFKNARDYINKMIAIDKKNWTWSKSEDKYLREKYFNEFLRDNLEWDFTAHLPWLKWVNLKQIEWKLTDKNLRDIAEMIALVSKTFWIDFNKIVNDWNISINIVNEYKDFLYNTKNHWVMSWLPTKEQVRELIEKTWEWNMWLAWDIIKMWVAITLKRWPEWSGSTMAHELFHLIDFALSTEKWLPLYYESYTRNWVRYNVRNYTSIIEWDPSWRTYTVWTYRPTYYNRATEVLARYAQQYFAYKNSPKIFEEYCKRDWYWSEDEFLKLKDKFEDFIKNELWTKLLDEENQFYYDIVSKINEWVYDYKNMEYNAEKMNQTELQLKLLRMETNYAWILKTLEWMKWDLKEEMEAYVQLSNLQSNYEMAKAKWEEYLEKLRTTPEQQDTIDNITTTVLPPVETPENPNPVPPQEPEKIMLWLPYYWWSNMENWIDKIAKGESIDNDMQKYTDEEKVIMKRKKGAIRTYWRELKDAWFDAVTPAISRIYNRSPRVAWRLITMETQTQINTHRYREKARWFVETLWKLKGKDALEVKMALLDYWALASEQTEDTINEYKQQEVIKLRNVLLKHWFKEQDINDMFYVLNDIWQQYKDAWLDITLTDMYFPRVVKDYEWLIDYMNMVSGKDIKVNKTSLLIKIREIQGDPNMTPEEKEKRIRSAISIEFHQPWTTSKHGKERKLWLLSERGPWIYAYYENPIQSLDHYIVTMTSAIQRQLFLGWMREDAGITEWDILNQNTAESVSTILWKLVEEWMVDKDDVDVIQKAILSVLNKKASPKVVTATKDITYMATITNFLSAINQLDDLWMTILRDRSWLKNIVKTIFKRAWIKYDDLWLDDSYEMFREEWSITNWLFKKSFFNAFDRLGKTSFINTAWESMVRQAKNEKTKQYLKTRLVTMYWEESAERMMKKIEKGDYKWKNWQMDIEILRDLLYQLWSTQPIYTSAMPIAYLNHPWTRLCYALSSFTLKRIDWLVQWTKEVNAKHWPVVAWLWVMWVSTYLALFWAIIWDAGDWLKWKKEETFLWNLLNKWIDDALKKWWSNALNSWLKIWDLSDYDIQTWDKKWMYELLMSKVKPFIFDLWEDMYEAIKEHDKDEITDLAKYVPIFGKLVYYWCWDDLESATKKSWEEWDWDEEEERDWDSDEERNWDEEEEWNWDEE